MTLNLTAITGTLADVPLHITPTQALRFDYRNWRGVTATRTVDPISLWFGTTKWHPDPQWFLRAMDLEKHEIRDFSMQDMTGVHYARP